MNLWVVGALGKEIGMELCAASAAQLVERWLVVFKVYLATKVCFASLNQNSFHVCCMEDKITVEVLFFQ